MDIDQVLDAVRPVIPLAMLGHPHMPLTLERLIPEEEIDCPLALVFIVFPSGDAELLEVPGRGGSGSRTSARSCVGRSSKQI